MEVSLCEWYDLPLPRVKAAEKRSRMQALGEKRVTPQAFGVLPFFSRHVRVLAEQRKPRSDKTFGCFASPPSAAVGTRKKSAGHCLSCC